jgi:hypothetical protein
MRVGMPRIASRSTRFQAELNSLGVRAATFPQLAFFEILLVVLLRR